MTLSGRVSACKPSGGNQPGSRRLATTGVELSRAAQIRLAWIDFYGRNHNVALTCRHFGIVRQTYYRWRRRYRPLDLTSLEERSHCPHHRRQPTWSWHLEGKILRLRLQFPRWGKDKLAVLLRQQGEKVSTSMVGRILIRLKQRGQVKSSIASCGNGNASTTPCVPIGFGLPHASPVPAPVLISTKGMKVSPIYWTCTHRHFACGNAGDCSCVSRHGLGGCGNLGSRRRRLSQFRNVVAAGHRTGFPY